MTATAHALIGGVIAASVPNPALGISLSAASHPLVDLIPHWDFGWGWKKKNKIILFLQAFFDLAFGFILAYLIFGKFVNFWYFTACVLASEAWDILESPYWFLNWRFPPFSWIYKIQSSMQGRLKLPWGIVTQAATVGGLVLVLRTFH